MTETPNEDQPGFVAEEPEHCFACYRLIRPGQAHYLTLEQEVLCADCALDDTLVEGGHPRREDLAAEQRRPCGRSGSKLSPWIPINSSSISEAVRPDFP